MILVWNKLNNLFWTVVKNSRNFPSSQHSTRKTIYLRFSQKMSKILDKKAICDDFSRRKNPPKKVYKKRCDVVKWNERIEKSWSTLYNHNNCYNCPSETNSTFLFNQHLRPKDDFSKIFFLFVLKIVDTSNISDISAKWSLSSGFVHVNNLERIINDEKFFQWWEIFSLILRNFFSEVSSLPMSQLWRNEKRERERAEVSFCWRQGRVD